MLGPTHSHWLEIDISSGDLDENKIHELSATDVEDSGTHFERGPKDAELDEGHGGEKGLGGGRGLGRGCNSEWDWRRSGTPKSWGRWGM